MSMSGPNVKMLLFLEAERRQRCNHVRTVCFLDLRKASLLVVLFQGILLLWVIGTFVWEKSVSIPEEWPQFHVGLHLWTILDRVAVTLITFSLAIGLVHDKRTFLVPFIVYLVPSVGTNAVILLFIDGPFRLSQLFLVILESSNVILVFEAWRNIGFRVMVMEEYRRLTRYNADCSHLPTDHFDTDSNPTS